MKELVLENVNKSYGEKLALSNFSYRMEPGVYGILGANGAGKSTLMKGIACIHKFDSGSVTYSGRKVDDRDREYRSAIGYMPQSEILYPSYTLVDYLMYIAALKGISAGKARSEVDKVIERVNLKSEAGNRLKSFSGGMKQRAMLAQAILGDPEILILDEPSAGVDPVERVRIRNMITELGENKIVIISTHIVPDVEISADRIIILKDGKIATEGSLKNLSDSIKESVFTVRCTAEEYNEFYKKNYVITEIKKEEDIYRIRLLSEEKKDGFECVAPSLDDVYMYYFNEESGL